MANGNGNGNVRMTWNVVLPVSALGLLGALLLNVGRDAQIVLEEDMRDRTQKRWTSEQAVQSHQYIQKDIQACFDAITTHERSHHGQ